MIGNRVKRLSLVMILVLMLVASLAAPGKALDTQPTMDPKLPIHPYLQLGIQSEPDRWIQVIVQMKDSGYDPKAMASLVKAKFIADYPFIRSFVLETQQKLIPTLASQPGVRYISVNGPGKKHAIDWKKYKSVHLQDIDLPDLLRAPGLAATGKGVTVAVIDTGIDPLHPAFAPEADGTPTLLCVKENGKASKCEDKNGHGTHVSGIIRAGEHAKKYIGVAPEADLISIRVDDDKGIIRESDLLNGLQWVYQNRQKYNIRVVNLSISAGIPNSYRTSPIDAAVEKLWTSGVVVVTAAGNRGSAADATWYSPGNDPLAISVGALDPNNTAAQDDDSLAAFSSRGFTQDGFYKPDILAPGRGIVAPLGALTELGSLWPNRIVDREYIRLSGTSMAAPIVTGVVALLLERFPKLTPDQVKWLLVTSARSYPNEADNVGVVDPLAAMELAAAGNIQAANQQVLGPAREAFAQSGSTDWETFYWENYYWDTYYWDTYYWDTYYWDTYYWDTYYWDAYYWATSDDPDQD